MVNSLISKIGSYIRPVFFPPVCVHCEESSDELFCSSCFDLFQWLDPSKRCKLCFKEKSGQSALCIKCIQQPFINGELASIFEYFGPVQTFIKLFKYDSQWYLAKTVAAFMIIQLNHLGWPIPDVVIPVPQVKLKTFFRGYNHSTLIAKEISKQLNVPFSNALIRRGGEHAQANLSYKQRIQLSKESFKLKKVDLENKTILLVDDVMTTGTTLRNCVEVLDQGFPEKIYALTLCVAQH